VAKNVFFMLICEVEECELLPGVGGCSDWTVERLHELDDKVNNAVRRGDIDVPASNDTSAPPAAVLATPVPTANASAPAPAAPPADDVLAPTTVGLGICGIARLVIECHDAM
jgi:hypothetical protein